MKYFYLLGLTMLVVLLSPESFSQTNTFPASGNVGIGTTNPHTKLHIFNNAADIIGLTIHGNTINSDLAMHYTGVRFAGDYGDGTGNSSEIRSYSNLYSQWGSSLRFYTTNNNGNNLIERMVIDEHGNVGIGTTNPTSITHIVGNTSGDGGTFSGAGSILRVTQQNSWSGNQPWALFVEGYSFFSGLRLNGAGGSRAVYKTYAGGELGIAVSGDDPITFTQSTITERMWINSGGNLLIGKTSQINTDYKLDVAGKIRAEEVVVNTTGADFVFKPDYKLPGLSDIEEFIKQNGHLPDIAPSSEMQENGMNMSEMQMKLLQKIEELTLYLIEQDKKLIEYKRENIELINRIEKLEGSKRVYTK